MSQPLTRAELDAARRANLRILLRRGGAAIPDPTTLAWGSVQDGP